jgi:hypothetical protein
MTIYEFLGVKILNVKRDKLNVKLQKCVFVCYGGDDLDYKVWGSIEKKIIRI